MTWLRWTPVAMLCLLATACGGGDSVAIEAPGPPIGKPLLPDIVPAPPTDVRMSKKEGKWLLSFSSILVNIGDGDFVLRATREDETWAVVQDIPYSTSGAEVVPVSASLVWGGDGHDHWHVKRVAVNTLVPLDEKGRPAADEDGWLDSKVGFCFYDFSRQLETGPLEAAYLSKSCGDENDTAVGMGLSLGWGDTYNIELPGQSIDVTQLPDGRYRLWAEADKKGWFRDARRDNNVTWVNIRLSTSANGVRAVRITKLGPVIRPDS